MTEKRIILVTPAELLAIHDLEVRCLRFNMEGQWLCDEQEWQRGLEQILGPHMVEQMLLKEGRCEFQLRVMEWDRG